MERQLLTALSVLVLAAGASCAGSAASSTGDPAQATIEGVWRGTFQADAASEEAQMCLHIVQVDEASNRRVVTGAIYLDGVWQGLVAGDHDPEGAISFGGGVEVGSFTGSVEEAAAFGVWDRDSADEDASGGWSLARDTGASCE